MITNFLFLGCCFVARNDLLRRLNGFDEIYAPYYWEDSDLSLRAIEHGFKVKFAPKCVIHHRSSSTIDHTQKKQRRRSLQTGIGADILLESSLRHKALGSTYIVYVHVSCCALDYLGLEILLSALSRSISNGTLL
jgi:GT2 family glycosyltransferase